MSVKKNGASTFSSLGEILLEAVGSSHAVTDDIRQDRSIVWRGVVASSLACETNSVCRVLLRLVDTGSKQKENSWGVEL